MAYATPDDLAAALEIRVTTENTPLLEACLAAAAGEIDATIDAVDGLPLTAPYDPRVVRTNVNRAVEWFKAPATYNGGVGFEQTGQLTAPTSGFERHAAVLVRVKQRFGVG